MELNYFNILTLCNKVLRSVKQDVCWKANFDKCKKSPPSTLLKLSIRKMETSEFLA